MQVTAFRAYAVSHRLLCRAIAWSLALGLTATACTTPAPSPQDQGKLQRASDKVSAPSSPKRSGSHSHGASSSAFDDDDGGWAELCAEVTWLLLGWPWWGPHDAMEGAGNLRAGYYLRHPYALSDAPLIQPTRAARSIDGARDPLHLRVTADYGTDFGAIDRLGAALRLETAVRVGLDASWSHYREELAGGGIDELDMGDINVVYRFAQSDYGEMRSGLGLNWFHKSPVNDIGFNFTYGGDFYLGNPWITSFEIDWGRIGAASRFHGRATIGVDWHGIEALAGFDYESLDSVGLPSWILGGRVWF